MRFSGQTSDIRIALRDEPEQTHARALRAAFETEHERLYGHRSDPDNPVEVTAIRLIGRADLGAHATTLKPVTTYAPVEQSRRAYFGPEWGSIETPIIARAYLETGCAGPLLIDEYDSTAVVPPGMRAWLDEQNQIVMEPEHE